MNAVLLQPMSAEAATGAAHHQPVAPRYGPDCSALNSVRIPPCHLAGGCWHPNGRHLSPTRHLRLWCSGLPAGVDSIAVAPILAPEAAAQQQAPVAARPSRKRMEPGADVAGTPADAPQAEGTAVGAPEAEPRQQKRRLLTGMAVVWRYFGIKDPKTPQNPTG